MTNLLKSVAGIALGVGAGYILGGGAKGTIDGDLGKDLASSFLKSGLGGGGTGGQPFKVTQITPPRPRSVEELTRGQSPVPANLQPLQQMVSASPRLETALRNLYANASNTQVQEVFSKYGADVKPTIQQGRRTIVTAQPKDIEVG